MRTQRAASYEPARSIGTGVANGDRAVMVGLSCAKTPKGTGGTWIGCSVRSRSISGLAAACGRKDIPISSRKLRCGCCSGRRCCPWSLAGGGPVLPSQWRNASGSKHWPSRCGGSAPSCVRTRSQVIVILARRWAGGIASMAGQGLRGMSVRGRSCRTKSFRKRCWSSCVVASATWPRSCSVGFGWPV